MGIIIFSPWERLRESFQRFFTCKNNLRSFGLKKIQTIQHLRLFYWSDFLFSLILYIFCPKQHVSGFIVNNAKLRPTFVAPIQGFHFSTPSLLRRLRLVVFAVTIFRIECLPRFLIVPRFTRARSLDSLYNSSRSLTPLTQELCMAVTKKLRYSRHR